MAAVGRRAPRAVAQAVSGTAGFQPREAIAERVQRPGSIGVSSVDGRQLAERRSRSPGGPRDRVSDRGASLRPRRDAPERPGNTRKGDPRRRGNWVHAPNAGGEHSVRGGFAKTVLHAGDRQPAQAGGKESTKPTLRRANASGDRARARGGPGNSVRGPNSDAPFASRQAGVDGSSPLGSTVLFTATRRRAPTAAAKRMLENLKAREVPLESFSMSVAALRAGRPESDEDSANVPGSTVMELLPRDHWAYGHMEMVTSTLQKNVSADPWRSRKILALTLQSLNNCAETGAESRATR